MRTLLPSCALVLGTLLSAQNASPTPAAAAPTAGELAAAKARLQASLQKCATLTDTAFTARWGPDKKKKDDNDPFAAMMGLRSSGSLHGSWHADSLHVAFDTDQDDEWVVAGRRTIAKDGTSDWKLRPGRFADGNKVDFVADPALLLQQLAQWDLAVTHRSVGALDDRPVEIVSVTLNADQVAEAVWTGVLPEAVTTATGGSRILRLAAIGGGGGRPPLPPPATTVDVAFHLDPGTNLIHQIHFRGYTKSDGKMGGGMVVVQAAGGVVRGGGDDEEEEADEKDEATKDAPLVYDSGLPNRPRKKMSVADYRVRLTDHGQKQTPPWNELQKKLLGR